MLKLSNFQEDKLQEEIKKNRTLKEKIIIQRQIIIADQEIALEVLNILNTCEEFALSILESGYIDHPAFDSIKKPYVETVQLFYLQLFIQIHVELNEFKYVVRLYEKWYQETQKYKREKEDKQIAYNKLINELLKE